MIHHHSSSKMTQRCGHSFNMLLVQLMEVFYPPASEQEIYHNCKGFCSQNGLFCCTFSLFFTYSLTGWEGSSSNARVFKDAITTDLVVPSGFYLLADAGFPHCKELLIPYQGKKKKNVITYKNGGEQN